MTIKLCDSTGNNKTYHDLEDSHPPKKQNKRHVVELKVRQSLEEKKGKLKH